MHRARFTGLLRIMGCLGICIGLATWNVSANQDAWKTSPNATAEKYLVPYSDVSGAKTVSLEYHSAPWADVLRRFCNAAGCRLKMTSLPAGTFSYHDDEKYTSRQALDILNGFLRQQQFLAVRHEDFLVGVNLKLPFPPELAMTVPPSELDHCGRNEFLRVAFETSSSRLAALANKNENRVGDYKRSPIPDIEDRLAAGLPLSPYGRVLAVTEPDTVVVMDFGQRMKGIRRALADESVPTTFKAAADDAPPNSAGAGPQAAGTAASYAAAERRAHQLAGEHRDKAAAGTVTEEQSRTAREKVAAAVTEAFETRQRFQEAELASFAARLEALRQAHRNREILKDRIIKRRVDQLLSNENRAVPTDDVPPKPLTKNRTAADESVTQTDASRSRTPLFSGANDVVLERITFQGKSNVLPEGRILVTLMDRTQLHSPEVALGATMQIDGSVITIVAIDHKAIFVESEGKGLKWELGKSFAEAFAASGSDADGRLPKPLDKISTDLGPFAADFEIADVAWFDRGKFKTPDPTPRVVAEETIAWTLVARRDLPLEDLRKLFVWKGLSEPEVRKLYEDGPPQDFMFRVTFSRNEGGRLIDVKAREQGYRFEPHWNRKALRKGERLRIWIPLGDAGAVGLVIGKATKATFRFPSLAEEVRKSAGSPEPVEAENAADDHAKESSS